MTQGGKGSKPRPFAVDQSTFDTNWNRIFGSKQTSEGDKQAQAWLRDEYYDLDEGWDHYSDLPSPDAYRKDQDADKS